MSIKIWNNSECWMSYWNFDFLTVWAYFPMVYVYTGSFDSFIKNAL